MKHGKKKEVYAEFYRKCVSQSELKDSPFPGDRWRVQVDTVVELSRNEFEIFAENLGEYRQFIEDHAGEMYYDDSEECARCLLVTTPEQKEGILVQSEGFAYARYAAYIPDCKILELQDAGKEQAGELAHRIYAPKEQAGSEQKIKSARFHFRAADLIDIKECPRYCSPEPFQIIRRFCLPQWKFMEFASDLARRNPWLNRPDVKAFYYEIGEDRKCVAVTTDSSMEAILVDTQGYDYARICAYVPDYHQLELSGVPVTYYNGVRAIDEKSAFIETAVFYRGANTLTAFDSRNPHSHPDSFQIEKMVVLEDDAYIDFSHNLKQDYEFLFSNHRSMYFEPDRQCWHCLFVTGEHADCGILVDAEGYAHAEYAALITNRDKLDLSEIPVESYLPAPQERILEQEELKRES